MNYGSNGVLERQSEGLHRTPGSTKENVQRYVRTGLATWKNRNLPPSFPIFLLPLELRLSSHIKSREEQ